MRRIDKMLLVLSREEVESIRQAVARRDRVEALRLVNLLGKKIELMLKKKCR